MTNSDDVLIKVENVSKKFCRSLKRSMLYGIEDISRDLLHLPNTSDKLRGDEFWAVDDVSFEVKRGECLGIIGRNGAGKSTLLKMLNGIILPDKGKITIKGKVGALIEVGAGFHPMLTGRENIYVNGAILGMSKREIDNKFDEIVAFAELEEFIDMPVKHYSSGMYVRLGFAIAVQVDPDVLILDEILAVGDASFRAKCFKKINELRDRSISFIFVSHSFNAIALICKTALYISKGRQAFVGDAQTVLNQYQIDLTNSGTNNIIDQINNIAHYFTLTHVYFKNKDGIPAITLITGEPVTLTSMFCATKNIKNVCFHISIKRNCGGDGVLEINNIIEKFPFDINTNNSEINLFLPYLGLKTGIYQAHLSIREGALIILSEADFSFKVKGNLNIASNLFYQPHEWHVQ